MGSRAFFHALGAETAPRLTTYPDWQTLNLLSDRRSEIHGLRTTAKALRGDSKSEDLLRVLEDICRTKKKERQIERHCSFRNTFKKLAALLCGFYTRYNWQLSLQMENSWKGILIVGDAIKRL